jgi:hypothetical protein
MTKFELILQIFYFKILKVLHSPQKEGELIQKMVLLVIFHTLKKIKCFSKLNLKNRRFFHFERIDSINGPIGYLSHFKQTKIE